MGSKQKNKTYLFQVKDNLPAITMFAAEAINETQWQLYWLLNEGTPQEKFVAFDEYDSRPDSRNLSIYECLGEGRLIWRVFADGIVSDEIKRFLKKPENEKYRVWFVKEE